MMTLATVSVGRAHGKRSRMLSASLRFFWSRIERLGERIDLFRLLVEYLSASEEFASRTPIVLRQAFDPGKRRRVAQYRRGDEPPTPNFREADAADIFADGASPDCPPYRCSGTPLRRRHIVDREFDFEPVAGNCGIALQKLEITTEGDIDLRGFFGLDQTVAAGYRELRSTVVIKGDGTEEQLRKIHDMVLATSPNFYNITPAVRVVPQLTIE